MLGAAFFVLAKSLTDTSRLAEAETAAREALTIRRRYLKPSHWLVYSTRSLLGDIVAGQGRRIEERIDLTEGLAGLEQELGPTHRRTVETRARGGASISMRSFGATARHGVR
ncbi:MAG: tetratricopeptide repeat protein [Gemmatimonas sp.]